MRHTIRSIIAATDLGDGSDAIVSTAARIAAHAGAELHILHSLEFPSRPATRYEMRSSFFHHIEEAEARLNDQVRRTMPEGWRPASQQVIIYVAHKAILDRAEEVSADLIVVGPHRGGPAGAHFLGTTADRVIRAAEIPCLVVQEPLAERIRRIGVPIDCSDPSQGALEVALAWALQLGGADEEEARSAPEIRVMHVGWTVERIDNPDREERVLIPELKRQVQRAVSRISGAEALDVGIEVLWGNDPAEETVGWVKSSGIDLLVMGTHGTSGLKRTLLGSMASSVARRNPCPVLLVPPSFWSGHANEPRLERVMLATDFHESALEAARWSIRHLAPEAEHSLVHVLDVPQPPPVLAGRYGSREELLRTAREGVRHRLEELRIALEAQPHADGARPINTMVREGEPADEIVRLAEAADMDLIVMSRRGRSDREQSAWTMLGTTVERVLRASTIPVFVAAGLPEGPPRNLLVAVDGSKPSLRALAWADFLRRQFGGTVTAIHVESPVILQYADFIPSNVYTAMPVSATTGSADPAAKPEWMRAREEWLLEEVQRAGHDPDTMSLRVALGRPAGEILAEQERCGADLIVMGTHGAGRLVCALLGSVAGEVLDRSPCSVLVLGDPDRAGW